MGLIPRLYNLVASTKRDVQRYVALTKISTRVTLLLYDVTKLEHKLRRNYLLIGIGVSVASETSGSPGFRRAARTIHWPVRDQRLNRNEEQLLNRRGGTSPWWNPFTWGYHIKLG